MPLPDVIPTIETDRLCLRNFEFEDADDMHAIYADVETMKYWSGAASQSEKETRDLVYRDMKAVKDGLAMFWALELKETGEVIGKCTLWQFSEANRRAEVGYILSRKHWRGGLMTEALTAMIDFAFSDLNLHRLEADSDDKNMASLTLLEKLGFQREGFFRERWYVNETWQHSVMLGLLKQEWHGSQ
jgi:ribosomal-protein-alanine N-acetyltransferase